MKLLSKVIIRIKHGFLPHFINELCKSGCAVKLIESIEVLQNAERFSVEVLYDAGEQFRSVIQKLKRHPENFSVESVSNLLENLLVGGMLEVSGKGKFENKADYEMMVQGAAGMIIDKIQMGESVEELSGMHYNVAMINVLHPTSEKAEASKYIVHALTEKDSVVLKRFSGLNGFPLLIRAHHPEDIIKILRSIEESFVLLRIFTIEGVCDASTVSYISSELHRPIVYREFDELPLLLLYTVIKIAKKKKMSYDDCNAGMIGLNLAAIRLTRLLKTLGFARVLGCDNDERLMMNVEKEGALATTQENIFSNSDIIFLFKNQFTVAELSRIRPGQVIISLIDDREVDEEIIASRGVKDYIPSEYFDLGCVFPGILMGMKNSGISAIQDQQLLKTANAMAEMKGENLFPDIFSEVHAVIERSFSS
ncbi:MAG: hypothetical protein N2316_10540 [Spirochaetes bacterium]|nr:hypothetical protein [Spirochaetota bacterium]